MSKSVPAAQFGPWGSRAEQIQRMHEEVKAGLRVMTVEQVWEIVEELLPDAELAATLEKEGLPAYLRKFPSPPVRV